MPKNSPLDADLEAKRKELRALNDTIADRKRYRNEQEKLINELVETGNSQLMNLIHENALAKKELRDLKTDIRTAAQDKVILNEDLEGLRGELAIAAGQLTTVPAFG